MITVLTADADGTRAAARTIATRLHPGDLLILDGPLGAGKTTFTQGLGAGLGVRGPVASPTFVIARVHPSLGDGPALAHVDSYRLGGGFDVDDLDLDSELDRAVTVVEWGRGQVEHLADSHLLIELDRSRAASDADTAADPDPSAEDDLEEPRRLRLLPSGPRWDAEAVLALRTALEQAGLDLADDPLTDQKEN